MQAAMITIVGNGKEKAKPETSTRMVAQKLADRLIQMELDSVLFSIVGQADFLRVTVFLLEPLQLSV